MKTIFSSTLVPASGNPWRAVLIPAALITTALTLSSCVVAPGPPVVRAGYWETVPATYAGDSFLIGSRYYYGGLYEEGDFVFEGRHYPCRYLHNGRYLYGGRLMHHHGGLGPDRGHYDHRTVAHRESRHSHW